MVRMSSQGSSKLRSMRTSISSLAIMPPRLASVVVSHDAICELEQKYSFNGEWR